MPNKFIAAVKNAAKTFVRSFENPNIPLNQLWYGPPGLSGVTVSEHTALSYNAVWACINRISTDVGSLKYATFEHRLQGGKQAAKEHWSYDLIHHTPDGIRPAFNFYQTLLNHRLRYGNGFAEIEYLGGGYPSKLHLLDPDRMTVRLVQGRLVYDYLGCEMRPARKFSPWQIVHIKGLSHNGIVGYSPIRVMRESIGVGLSGDIAQAAWLGNANQPGGVLEFPPEMDALSEQAQKQKREEYDAMHGGPLNKGRLMFSYKGIKYTPLQLPAPDQNFLASRQWSIEDCCRIYSVDPPLVGHYEHATYSNVEQAIISYLNKVVRPEAENLCNELNLKLFIGEDRGRYVVRPNYHELLRADSAARTVLYSGAKQWGWLSTNEIRNLEDMNEIGPDGDIYLSPVNMVSATQAGQLALSFDNSPPSKTPDPEPPKPDNKALDAVRSVVVNELQRAMRREIAAVRKAAAKPNFREWLPEHYAEHREYLTDALGPSLKALEAVGGELPDLDKWCDGSLAELQQLESVCTSDQLPTAIEDVFAGWENRLAEF